MTKYEEELKERVAEVGDKFILRGRVYEAKAGVDLCRGCVFNLGEGLCLVNTLSCAENDVVYIEVKEG